MDMNEKKLIYIVYPIKRKTRQIIQLRKKRLKKKEAELPVLNTRLVSFLIFRLTCYNDHPGCDPVVLIILEK